MPKRQLNAKEILTDLRVGMNDTTLKEKYQLSAQGLQSVFEKLITAGLLEQSEVDDRLPSHERTVNLAWKCPACGKPQPREFEVCPDCGVIVRKYNPNATPSTASDTDGVMFGRAKVLWGVAFLLLLGILGAGWYYLGYPLEAASAQKSIWAPDHSPGSPR